MSGIVHEEQNVNVPARVRAIVAEAVRRPVDEVPLEAKLESGLGVDSMVMIEIGVSIEEQFDIALPPELADEVRVETVGDLVGVVETQLTSRKRRN
ncbi:MAG TPA: acyl carrier protein [Polyangiaceae bacterium]|jgi:acyl carrier protein